MTPPGWAGRFPFNGLAAWLVMVVILTGCGAGPPAVSPPPPTAMPTPRPSTPAALPVTVAPSPTATPPSPTLPPTTAPAPKPVTTSPVLPRVDPTAVAAATLTANGPTSAEMGRPFWLRIGQTVAVGGTDLRLEFQRVAEDSRCPTMVNCVWIGRASVVLALRVGSQQEATQTLMTPHSPQPTDRATFAGYEVRLAGVTPRADYPDRPIRPEEYVAQLVVTRSASA